MSISKPKLIVILGQTASGKSELAIRLAKKFNGEIISADSRQIYKGLDIGTAKLNKEKIKSIPHHLIDIILLKEKFNVALFKELAKEKIKEIHKRKKLPFLVGGTGLYIDALVENFKFPKISLQKKIRKSLDDKNEKELFAIYKKLDPVGAKFIEEKNKRRLIRAIEVCKITKNSFWEKRKKEKAIFESLKIGIKLPKEELEIKIKNRTRKMIKNNLEGEVKKLVKKYGWSVPLQTIGYREWKEYFEKKISKKDVENLISLHTLQFSRRQMTWFSRDKNIKWIQSYKEGEKKIKNFIK